MREPSPPFPSPLEPEIDWNAWGLVGDDHVMLPSHPGGYQDAHHDGSTMTFGMEASEERPMSPMTRSLPQVQEPHVAAANGPSEARRPNFGTSEPDSVQQARQHTYSSPTNPFRNDHANPRRPANNNTVSQAAPQVFDDRSRVSHSSSELQHQYNPPFFYQHSEAHSSPMQQPSYLLPQSQAPGSGAYSAFGGLFATAGIAADERKRGLRRSGGPYRPPEDDPSIQDIQADRQFHVKRIYDAMTRPDAAKDNSGSIAMRRWVHTAFYPPNLVEAFAHKVFDCLLDQTQHGFRGWQHNDYASDERKGEPEDKEVSCSERLASVIKALEEEKTICEDVMTSSCQIRMFVNAPRAYARRKEANRHGNSKRGRARDAPTTDTSSRATKTRRLNARPGDRSRQATPSSVSPPPPAHAPLSQNFAIRQPFSAPTPYYPPQRLQPAPPVARMTTNFRPGLAPGLSENHIYSHAMTPQALAQPLANISRVTSIPPGQHAAMVSPPPVTGASAPATPNEQLPHMNTMLWSMGDNFGLQPLTQASNHTAPFGSDIFEFGSTPSPHSRPRSSGMPQPNLTGLPSSSAALNDNAIDPALKADSDFGSYFSGGNS